MLRIKSNDNIIIDFDLRLMCYESKFIYNLFLLNDKNNNEVEIFYNSNKEIEIDYNSNYLILLKKYFDNCILNTDKFLSNLNKKDLIDIINISHFLNIDRLYNKSCNLISKDIKNCKNEHEIISYFNLKLTNEELEEIKNN